ncbi:DUF7544 domain-containing protein [Halorubrum sp. DTA46]|uniref:DUF7544 domain-containing protein n=1 Tax=Halorubrum sp. DTA46 TaxID=3402162 RepID=UPI003AADE10B
MSWHAVDAVDDAVEATRRFLFPFSLVRWAKLSFLVLLMGGGASANVSVPPVPEGGVSVSERGSSVPGAIGSGTVGGTDGIGAVDGPLLAAIVAGLLLAVIALSVASLSLRLVFYDALRTNHVRLWRPFVERFRQAAGLFVVSVALSLGFAAPVAIAVIVSALTSSPTGWERLDSAATAIASLPTEAVVAVGVLGAVIGLVALLVLRLTFEFVVPTMIVEDIGVISGWGRLWRSLRGRFTDLIVYLLVHFVIGIGIAVAEGLAVVLVGSVVAVVAGLVLLIASVPLGGIGAILGTTAGTAVLGVVLLGAAGALLLLLLPVRVLTRSYLITYEVSTLAGIDRSLALLHPDLDPASATVTASES